MRRRLLLFTVLLALLAGAALALALRAARGGARGDGVRATLSATALLGAGDTAGFARATRPRAFRFPADHGPHPGFRNEWWYFTGNLTARDGRRFGYELTFFRAALTPRPAARASEWAAGDVYMAHFAITDAAADDFRARDRFERGGSMALAGALAPTASRPWRVWVDDWQATSATPFWPITLVARDSGMALRLTLARGKPPVLEGDSGLSRKGPEPGNASYYYSLTRMPTSGWLEVDGRRYPVAGESWMDREWSTSALSPDEVGWDWLALQLSNGRELMLYRIRRRDGSVSPFSGGKLVRRDGRSRVLAAADARVDVQRTWASPRDGARYPASWRVRVPSAALDLEVRPIVADQELNLAVRYWEGAVDVAGSAAGRPVTGRGYVELTGYASPAIARGRAGAASR